MPATKKLSKRELKIVITTGVLAALYFFQGSILEPLGGFLKRSTGQMDKNQIELKQYLQTVSQKEYLAQEMKVYGEFFSKPGAAADIESEGAAILPEIEELARSHNVTLTALTPKEPTKGDLLTEYRVDITTQSTQRDLIRFLYALQTAEGIFYPEKLQIMAAKIQETSAVQAQMTLVKAVVYAE